MAKQEETNCKIHTVEDLLAHALALETDAAEKYREIADVMKLHNNPEVADLFMILASYADQHAGEMQEKARGMKIPHIAPWDFVWAGDNSPETADMSQIHYKMTPYHVLHIALTLETDARDFYAKIAKESTNKDVILLAAEFADEETEHVELLQNWIPRYPKPAENWEEDLDPPVVHE